MLLTPRVLSTSSTAPKTISPKRCSPSRHSRATQSGSLSSRPTTPPLVYRQRNSPTVVDEPCSAPPTMVSTSCVRNSSRGSPISGLHQTSNCVAMIERSRRCGGTCSSSPRHLLGHTSRASPRRPSPPAATTGTTSGTPRCTSHRSSLTPTRRPRGRSSAFGGRCSTPLGRGPKCSARTVRSIRGAPSTAKKRRPTTPLAPRNITSTQRWSLRFAATSTQRATSSSLRTRAPRFSSRPRGCGPILASTTPTDRAASTSTR